MERRMIHVLAERRMIHVLVERRMIHVLAGLALALAIIPSLAQTAAAATPSHTIISGITAEDIALSDRTPAILIAGVTNGKARIVTADRTTNRIISSMTLASSDGLGDLALDETRQRAYVLNYKTGIGTDAASLYGVAWRSGRIVFHVDRPTLDYHIARYAVDPSTGAVFVEVRASVAAIELPDHIYGYTAAGRRFYDQTVTDDPTADLSIGCLDEMHGRLLIVVGSGTDAAEIMAVDTRSGRQLWGQWVVLQYRPPAMSCAGGLGQAAILQPDGSVSVMDTKTGRFVGVPFSGGSDAAVQDLSLDQRTGAGVVITNATVDFLDMRRRTRRTIVDLHEAVPGIGPNTSVIGLGHAHCVVVGLQRGEDNSIRPIPFIDTISLRTGEIISQMAIPVDSFLFDAARASDGQSLYAAIRNTNTDPNTQQQTIVDRVDRVDVEQRLLPPLDLYRFPELAPRGESVTALNAPLRYCNNRETHSPCLMYYVYSTSGPTEKGSQESFEYTVDVWATHAQAVAVSQSVKQNEQSDRFVRFVPIAHPVVPGAWLNVTSDGAIDSGLAYRNITVRFLRSAGTAQKTQAIIATALTIEQRIVQQTQAFATQ